MPANATNAAAPTASPSSTSPTKKSGGVPEKKYKCQFCNRAFSRSEHRSRHERSRKFICFLNVGFGGAVFSSHAFLMAGSKRADHDFLPSPQIRKNVRSNA